MNARVAATLICLCGAASAATCGNTATNRAQAQGTRPADGLILATLALPGTAPAAPEAAAPREPHHDERGLLLAGLALMAAIALRRAGGSR